MCSYVTQLLSPQARALGVAGRELQAAAKAARSLSEREEAEGAASQGPAEGLLRDSRRLNDQSNLVLDQSHSPQAKALAALDLKMAQSLAQRAADGMAKAKAHFARAIAARKRAVADDESASADVTEAAQASLADQPGDAALERVLQGQESGGGGVAAVMTADVAVLEQRERQLGAADGLLGADQRALAAATERLAALGEEAGSLQKELALAEASVRKAAWSQSAAERLVHRATVLSIAAEKAADMARATEAGSVRKSLAAAVAQKRVAGRDYKAAMRKVAELSGKQTLLQVYESDDTLLF